MRVFVSGSGRKIVAVAGRLWFFVVCLTIVYITIIYVVCRATKKDPKFGAV